MNKFRLGAIGMAVLAIPMLLTGAFYHWTIALLWGITIGMLSILGNRFE